MTVRTSVKLAAVLGLVVSGCAGTAGTRAASPMSTARAATTAVPATTDGPAPSVTLTPYPDSFPDFTTGTEPLPEVTDLPAPSTPSAGETISIGIADYEQYGDLESLVRDASVVVSGRAGSITPAAPSSDPKSDFLRTEVPFTVDRVLRGDPAIPLGASITLTQMGGPGTDGVTRRLGGAEFYETGRCYVAFLKYGADDDVFYAVGGAQGVRLCDNRGALIADPFMGAQTEIPELAPGATVDALATRVSAIG